MTRSRTKIEHIPDDEIEIKQEDCTIRDVLSSEDDDDDKPNYGTNVEIKSEDEESYGDLDLSPLGEIKSEQESNSDMDEESEHVGFKMLTFGGNNSYSSDDDDYGEDPLKFEYE